MKRRTASAQPSWSLSHTTKSDAALSSSVALPMFRALGVHRKRLGKVASAWTRADVSRSPS